MSFRPRDLEDYPLADDDLGQALLGTLESHAAENRLVRPSVLALTESSVEHYDVVQIARDGHDVHRFIAAVAGQPGVDLVGVVGVLGVRRGRQPSRRGLVVFLEWPDCRWWSALRLLDDRTLRDDFPAMVKRADEGHPRPGGLGGWWTRSRFEGLRLNVGRARDTQGNSLVH